ncbi:MAG: carboxylating nicotinate-nucleotide diphosphorylase, partial [Myxococcota bacterium]
RLVRAALEEDLARGDLTSDAVFDPDTPGTARLVAREALVLAGLPVVRAVFSAVDGRVRVEAEAAEGDALAPGDVAARLHGPARSLLHGERVALNFAQRMSGIATAARRYVDALPEPTPCRIADTRKTTPLLRALERYAVRCGGAFNHREDLGAAVMLKDNHLAAAGGVRAAVARVRAYAPHTTRIELEVDTMEQLREALEVGVDIVMLDNFDDAATRQAVALIAGRCLVEASGGITLPRVGSLAKAGVDVISVGALTHSSPAVDLGLDWGT